VLLIHAVLVLPFVLNLSLHSPRRPNTTGAGATAFASAAEPEMTVVFIDEPTPATSTSPSKPPPLASRGVTPPDVQLVVLSPDPSPAAANVQTADSTDAQEDTASAEAAEHARLYGRYLGQVQARIERAWMRPRSEIGAPQFSCRTRIQQDRREAVVEVTLDHCNGTERWQKSLVSAIRTASPLPAPPDASVYADILWLSFSSEGFEEGSSTQGFEPEASQTGLVRDSDIARQSFEQFASGARRMFRPDGKEDSKVIHLTIVGSSSPGASPLNELPADPLPPPLPQSAASETPPQ
jgi:TonB-like protein